MNPLYPKCVLLLQYNLTQRDQSIQLCLHLPSQFHNKHHRYSYLKGKTPLETIQNNGFEPLRLGANTKLPDLNTVADGNIILIRFIRSNRILDIFGEKFKVSKSLVYSYVKAVIVTEIHRLQLYLGEELVDSFDY